MKHTNMRRIWKQKITELDETIRNLRVCDMGRLIDLYYKRELLELAFNNCR